MIVSTLSRFLLLLLGLSIPLAGWTKTEAQVVSSFTIPNEWVGRVTAHKVSYLPLIPSGGELHGYSISAADSRTLTKAKLIVGINPELEPWLANWAQANRREKDLLPCSPAFRQPPLDRPRRSKADDYSPKNGPRFCRD